MVEEVFQQSVKVLSVSSALNDDFLSFPLSFQLINIQGDNHHHLINYHKNNYHYYKVRYIEENRLDHELKPDIYTLTFCIWLSVRKWNDPLFYSV